MKTINYIVCALALLMCFGCKTPQLVTCEEVSKANDLPWLASIVKTGRTSWDQKLIRIDKITYSVGIEEVLYIGFDVLYESQCCDIPDEFIYNCDGEEITEIGGIAGCTGECEMTIHSRINLYTAK